MVQKSRKLSLITAISVLVVLLGAIGVVALLSSLNKKDDPYVQSQSTDTTNIADQDTEDTVPPSEEDITETDTESVDPATLTTIDISPLSISVSYAKGVGAFEYEVLRAPNGTRYVEFRSADIIGTKCTNDAGAFASIIVNPTDSESTTLSKTTKIDDTTYGLSLADPTCASDTTKLDEYQKSFSDGFSQLKKIE